MSSDGTSSLNTDPYIASEIDAYMAALLENSSTFENHVASTLKLVGNVTCSAHGSTTGGLMRNCDSGSILIL